jgi:hypothetical protein
MIRHEVERCPCTICSLIRQNLAPKNPGRHAEYFRNAEVITDAALPRQAVYGRDVDPSLFPDIAAEIERAFSSVERRLAGLPPVSSRADGEARASMQAAKAQAAKRAAQKATAEATDAVAMRVVSKKNAEIAQLRAELAAAEEKAETDPLTREERRAAEIAHAGDRVDDARDALLRARRKEMAGFLIGVPAWVVAAVIANPHVWIPLFIISFAAMLVCITAPTDKQRAELRRAERRQRDLLMGWPVDE